MAKDHFIPVSLDDLRSKIISEIKQQSSGSALDSAGWQSFSEAIVDIYHQRFHQRLRAIKQHYAVFAPDSETPLLKECGPQEKEIAQTALVNEMGELLTKANYQRIGHDQLTSILQESSPQGVEVEVDLDAYDELLIFARGRSSTTVRHRSWQKFWRETETEVAQISRLFLLFRLKAAADDSAVLPLRSSKKNEEADEALIPGAIHLRLFKNIPEADLEALFPNSKVRLRLFDKIKLAVTGGGGTVGGLMATISKVAAAANPVTLLIAIGGFAGILSRQVRTVFAHQTRYMMRLARHLYFHSLASNSGVITRLLDMAEEEECKEALLGYYVLAVAEQPLTMNDWDRAAEDWLRNHCDVDADFEVADAAEKLVSDGLVGMTENAEYSVVMLTEANTRLNQYWQAMRGSTAN